MSTAFSSYLSSECRHKNKINIQKHQELFNSHTIHHCLNCPREIVFYFHCRHVRMNMRWCVCFAAEIFIAILFLLREISSFFCRREFSFCGNRTLDIFWIFFGLPGKNFRSYFWATFSLKSWFQKFFPLTPALLHPEKLDSNSIVSHIVHKIPEQFAPLQYYYLVNIQSSI